MNIHEIMKTRRSVRRFKPDPIPEDIMQKIMESAIWAPSAMNRQQWKFYILTDEMRDRLATLHTPLFAKMEERLRERYDDEAVELRRELYSNLGRAPVAVVCFSDRNPENPHYSSVSAALACENLVLAAWAEGIGSVMLASSRAMSDEISFLCGVDEDKLEMVMVILLGYPDEEPEAPARRKKRVVYAATPGDIRNQ